MNKLAFDKTPDNFIDRFVSIYLGAGKVRIVLNLLLRASVFIIMMLANSQMLASQVALMKATSALQVG